MKIFGHPIHLMLIHFPSALFPMDVVCSVFCYSTGNDAFYVASFYAMVGGVVSGWVAAIAGMLDLGSIAKDKPSSLKKALIHGGINSVVLIAYSIVALFTYKFLPGHTPHFAMLTVFKISLVMLMIAGNFIGGDLILKDKVLEKS